MERAASYICLSSDEISRRVRCRMLLFLTITLCSTAISATQRMTAADKTIASSIISKPRNLDRGTVGIAVHNGAIPCTARRGHGVEVLLQARQRGGVLQRRGRELRPAVLHSLLMGDFEIESVLASDHAEKRRMPPRGDELTGIHRANDADVLHMRGIEIVVFHDDFPFRFYWERQRRQQDTKRGISTAV